MNKKLPLIDLHRHLDGNIRPKSIWELAIKNNIQLPEEHFQDFIPHVQIQKSEPDLVSFLKKLDWGVSVLKSLDDIKRIAYENVEDVFNEGIDYAELRFSPYYMAMNHNLDIKDVVSAIIDGTNLGMKDFDTKVKLIGIMSRTFGVDACQKELDAILYHKENIVAVDLAGDELGFSGDLFNKHFKQVRDAGLNITVHAGEAAGPSSIYQAIDELGATRIGHGVACAKDENLMNYMLKKDISLESCLTSNYQTGTIEDIKNHPIKLFLDYGLKVCLNTDDPAVEGIDLKHEYDIARSIVGLSLDEIDTLHMNALDMCFISDKEKAELLGKYQ